MNDFRINGFLGKEAALIATENYNKHIELFQYCEELNKFAHEKLQNITIKGDCYEKSVNIISLYTKIINAYQAVVVLYNFGFDVEAQIICRTSLESCFFLSAIIKEDGFYEKFKKADEKEIECLLKHIYKNPETFSEFDNGKIKEDYDKKKAHNKNDNNSKIQEENVAKSADMVSEYFYAYKVLCKVAHPNIYNLRKRYLKFDEADNLIAFKSLPSTENIEQNLYLNCYILLKTLDCLNEYFSLDIGQEIEVFDKRMQNLN